jgi:hypothetical protein
MKRVSRENDLILRNDSGQVVVDREKASSMSVFIKEYPEEYNEIEMPPETTPEILEKLRDLIENEGIPVKDLSERIAVILAMDFLQMKTDIMWVRGEMLIGNLLCMSRDVLSLSDQGAIKYLWNLPDSEQTGKLLQSQRNHEISPYEELDLEYETVPQDGYGILDLPLHLLEKYIFVPYEKWLHLVAFVHPNLFLLIKDYYVPIIKKRDAIANRIESDDVVFSAWLNYKKLMTNWAIMNKKEKKERFVLTDIDFAPNGFLEERFITETMFYCVFLKHGSVKGMREAAAKRKIRSEQTKARIRSTKEEEKRKEDEIIDHLKTLGYTEEAYRKIADRVSFDKKEVVATIERFIHHSFKNRLYDQVVPMTTREKFREFFLKID